MSTIEEEKKMILSMIALYCKNVCKEKGIIVEQEEKDTNGLCPGCSRLYAYAVDRLNKCPFKNYKPSCRRCKIHCYTSPMKEAIQEVMRYSGPRMIFYRPILTIKHFLRSNAS